MAAPHRQRSNPQMGRLTGTDLRILRKWIGEVVECISCNAHSAPANRHVKWFVLLPGKEKGRQAFSSPDGPPVNPSTCRFTAGLLSHNSRLTSTGLPVKSSVRQKHLPHRGPLGSTLAVLARPDRLLKQGDRVVSGHRRKRSGVSSNRELDLSNPRHVHLDMQESIHALPITTVNRHVNGYFPHSGSPSLFG